MTRPSRSWLVGFEAAGWGIRDRLNPNARSATVTPVTHSGTRSERLSIGGRSRALVTLMDRLWLDLAGFVVAVVGFTGRSDARVAHGGTFFVRDTCAGQTLAFCLLLGRS